MVGAKSDSGPPAAPVAAASAVTIFHPGGPPGAFTDWVPGLLESARHAPGFARSRVSVYDAGPFDFDRAVEVSFASEDQLHSWLDSPQRADVLRAGQLRGCWPQTTDLVIVAGEALPPGMALFRHSVAPGKQAEFTTAQASIAARTATFPGFEGTTVFGPDHTGEWTSMIRFRRAHQLSRWLASPERKAAVPAVRASLTKSFSEHTSSAPFGSTVRTTADGAARITPPWKSAMLVLLVLYPTVMMLSRFMVPGLTDLGAAPWLSMWLSQVASVAALQWVMVPLAARALRRWLDPVDGSGWRISVVGAALVVAVYGATLLIFANVQVVQYWDYR